jgi:cell division protein ZapA
VAEVTVAVAGRSYRLACRDGDEPGLLAAADHLDLRASALADGLGAVGESRLLLMAALLVTGELLELREVARPGAPATADPGLAERLERLADRLEAASGLEPLPGRP